MNVMRLPPLLTAVVLTATALSATPHGRVSDAQAAARHTVRMGEYFYKPKKLTVHVGDRVRFVNTGNIEHTVADSTKHHTVRSRLIKPRPLRHGKSQTVAFKHAGRVYYLCTFHPNLMRGVIIVRR